jgi:hypothetical protein
VIPGAVPRLLLGGEGNGRKFRDSSVILLKLHSPYLIFLGLRNPGCSDILAGHA